MGGSRGYPIDESGSVKGKASSKKDTGIVPCAEGNAEESPKWPEESRIRRGRTKIRPPLCRNGKEIMNETSPSYVIGVQKHGMLPLINTNLPLKKTKTETFIKDFLNFKKP